MFQIEMVIETETEIENSVGGWMVQESALPTKKEREVCRAKSR